MENHMNKSIVSLFSAALLVLALWSTTTPLSAAPTKNNITGKWCGSAGGWNQTYKLKSAGGEVSGTKTVKKGGLHGVLRVSGKFDGARWNMRVAGDKVSVSLNGERLSETGSLKGNPSMTYRPC
jgi:hypothetical protein